MASGPFPASLFSRGECIVAWSLCREFIPSVAVPSRCWFINTWEQGDCPYKVEMLGTGSQPEQRLQAVRRV